MTRATRPPPQFPPEYSPGHMGELTRVLEDLQKAVNLFGVTAWTVFTPTLVGSTTAGTQTYDVQVGYYMRILSTVIFSAHLDISAKDAGIAGNVRVGGLPFPSANITNLRHAFAVSSVKGLDLSAGYTQVTADLLPNTSIIVIRQAGDNVASAEIAVAAMAADSSIVVSGMYRAL